MILKMSLEIPLVRAQEVLLALQQLRIEPRDLKVELSPDAMNTYIVPVGALPSPKMNGLPPSKQPKTKARKGQNGDRIVHFLNLKKGTACSPKLISESLGMSLKSVYTALPRLQKQRRVRRNNHNNRWFTV